MDCRTGRRRIPKVLAVEERTGDIAHLEAREKYFAFCSLCQALFAFCSSTTAPLFHCPTSVIVPRRPDCLAAPPRGILLVREDRRATVPTSTMFSWCVRDLFLGLAVSFQHPAITCSASWRSATQCSTTFATSTTCSASRRPAPLPILHIQPNEEACRRVGRPSVHALPHSPADRGQRSVMEPSDRAKRARAAGPRRVSPHSAGSWGRGP